MGIVEVLLACIGNVPNAVVGFLLKEKVEITVSCVENTSLTFPGLPVSVMYDNKPPVKNPWKITYILKNTGNTNIIGKGSRTSLVSEGIYIRMKNIKHVIQMTVTNDSIAELNKGILYFKQWKPGESIIIEALVESEDGGKPQLEIDGRDIINAKVIIQE